MSKTPEELALEVELRRPRRRRRDPLLRGQGAGRSGRLGRSLGRGGAMLLFGDIAGRQRSTVKLSYADRGRSARWGAHGSYLASEGAQRSREKGPGCAADRHDLGLAEA